MVFSVFINIPANGRQKRPDIFKHKKLGENFLGQLD